MKPKPTSPPRAETQCPGEEVLVAYSLGTLSGSETLTVANHMNSCDTCIRAMAELEGSADELISHLRLQRWDVPPVEEEDRELSQRLEMIALHPSQRLAGQDARDHEDAPEQVGPYQILELIGEGGMGKVYRARHLFLNKIVAVKLLAQDRLADPGAVARFVGEMKAIGTVNDPHIVRAFDAGLAEVPYLAMELIEGVDLSRLVKQRGPMSVADACECIRQAALGLQHAHELGLVHRDLKPSNLMLALDGTVKILDLGLARLAPEPPAAGAGGPRNSPSSTDLAIVGTPDYIAPEQLQRSHDVDIRADLFSLGCTLFYLLTGRPPFRRKDRLSRQPSQLSHLPPDIRTLRPDVTEVLAALLEQLLARDPIHRPDDPRSLAASLMPFTAGADLKALVGQDAPAPAPPIQPPAAKVTPDGTSGRSPALLIVSVFLIIFLLGMLWLREPGRTQQGPGAGSQEGLKVSLTVECYRPGGGGIALLGEVGAEVLSPSAQTDSFRVKAQLNEARYCALVAYNPRGEGVICFPANPQVPQVPTHSVMYPPEGFLRLPDPGLYTFVLLVSKAEWKEVTLKEIQETKLGTPPPTLNGVWRFDGHTVVALEGEAGNPDLSGAPPYIQDLCSSLSARRAESVQVLAFSVRE